MSDDPTKKAGHDEVDGTEGRIQIPIESVPEATGKAPHPMDKEVSVLKVNGKEIAATQAQLEEWAQKGMAADEKFREASETKKEAEAALALQADLEAVIKNDDEDAFRRLASTMQVPQEKVEELIQGSVLGEEDGEEDDDDEDVLATVPARKGPLGLEELHPDIQRALKIVERDRIEKIVQEALDNDDVVRYNMERRDEKGRQAIRSLVDEKIRGRLATTSGDFGDGSHILREVLPEVRTVLEALGSPEGPTPLGMGSAPGSGSGDVYPKKRPDHVPVSDADYDQSILETMAFHKANAERGSQ